MANGKLMRKFGNAGQNSGQLSPSSRNYFPGSGVSKRAMDIVTSKATGGSMGSQQQAAEDALSSSTNSDDDICRDFLRNVCNRGSRCKYKHPMADSKTRPMSVKSTTGLVFCHDYQNSVCSRANCRFFHGSRQDEEYYRATGDVPTKQGLMMSNLARQLQETVPVCKDHLSKGECIWGRNCKYLHVNGNDVTSRLSTSSDCGDEWDPQPDPKRRMLSHRLHKEEEVSSLSNCLHGCSSQQQRYANQPGRQLDVLALCEENILLRRQVDELKKQVSDLMATNELLLDQNARLRIHGKVAPSIPASSVTSVTVTLPSVTLPVTSHAFHNHHGIPTAVQTVQALATVPLVTAQSDGMSTLAASIPFATSVSLSTQPSVPLATVSIAPVTLNHQHHPAAAVAAAAVPGSMPSAGTATVTITPTGINASALQLHPHPGHSSALGFSGAGGGGGGNGNTRPLVSYPAIMTQSLMAPAELRTTRHVDFT